MRQLLLDKLSLCKNIKKDKTQYRTINIGVISLTELKTKLMLLGHILLEDIDNSIYVVSINLSKKSYATIAMKLIGSEIYMLSYAEDTLFDKNNAQKGLNKVEDALSSTTKKKRNVFPFLILVSIVTIIANVCSNVFIGTMKVEIEEFNSKISEYNALAKEYNELVEKIEVSNISEVVDSVVYLQPINNGFKTSIQLYNKKVNSKLIKKETEKLSQRIDGLRGYISILQNLDCPKKEWVIQKIQTIEEIDKIEFVTSDNDPNGLLGKDGGYLDCIYFSLKYIDQKSIPGDSVVEKGNDCGGTIEIYKTKKDAENRIQYLSQFDGTLLYSGSYAIVGTSVIRTSFKLNEATQFYITDKITKQLTSV